MRVRIFLFAFVLTAAPLFPQSTPGSVDGKVVNGVTGEEVKKAVVTIRNGTGQYTYVTATDQSGKFHVDNAQPEKYTAMADAEGFVPLRGGKLFSLAAGQELTGVEVQLAPLSVIAGKVVDEDGEPVEGVSVMVLRYVYNLGTKTLQGFGGTQTDDRGQYRIFDLMPGRYYLHASGLYRQARPLLAQGAERIHSTIPEEAYAGVIYPGVADVSQTSAHELKPGMDWTGADFKLRKLPAFHIRGRIDGLAAAVGGHGTVRAEPCNPDPIPGLNFQGPSIGRADGSFELAGAVPGTYCLSVMEPARGGIAARQTVTVKNADVNDVTLRPETPFSVKGTVVIDGTLPANPPTFNGSGLAAPLPGNVPPLGIGLRAQDDNRQMRAQVGADFTFQIDNIFPGPHTVALPSGLPLYVKSILYGGQDVSSGVIPNAQPGVPLTIVMGTDPGEIDGTVQAGSLEPGTPVTLAAMPDEAHAARSEMSRFTTGPAEGAFTLRGMAPGDYKVFALESQDFGDAQNRDLLKLLEGKATAVTVHPNGHEAVTVTPISASEIERAKEKLQ